MQPPASISASYPTVKKQLNRNTGYNFGAFSPSKYFHGESAQLLPALPLYELLEDHTLAHQPLPQTPLACLGFLPLSALEGSSKSFASMPFSNNESALPRESSFFVPCQP